MGKESKLRNPKPESRYSHSNGQRKLYDRDAMPDGLDSDIWSLVLYFEQLGEAYGCSLKRPIAYTELYHRVSKDIDFCNILPEDSNSLARARDTGGIYTIEELLDTLEQMIYIYWNTIAAVNVNSYIDEFCSVEVFNSLKQQILNNKEKKLLFTTGRRIPVEDRDVQPSRRTEEERERDKILHGKRTEEETAAKIEEFRRRNS